MTTRKKDFLRPPGINKAKLLQQGVRLVLLLLHLLLLP